MHAGRLVPCLGISNVAAEELLNPIEQKPGDLAFPRKALRKAGRDRSNARYSPAIRVSGGLNRAARQRASHHRHLSRKSGRLNRMGKVGCDITRV